MRYATRRSAKPHARIMFDTRKILKDGTYSVKLEIKYRDAKRRYITGVKVTKEEWEQMNAPGLRNEFLKKKRDRNERHLYKAKKLLEELGDDFNFDIFAYIMFVKTPK